MNDIVYRKAEKTDLQDILKLFKAVTENMILNNIDQWDDIYPNITDIQSDIENSDIYVGEISSQIVTVFTINQNYDEQYKNGDWQYQESDFYILHRLSVSPDFQNKGIGTKTMTYIENLLKENGCKEIKLDAFSLNPFALQLYKKRGFKVVGEVYWRKGMFYLFEKML